MLLKEKSPAFKLLKNNPYMTEITVDFPKKELKDRAKSLMLTFKNQLSPYAKLRANGKE